MLKLTPEPKFAAPVLLTVPGQESPAEIHVTFKYLSRKDLVSFYEGLKDRTIAEALGDIVQDWEGVDAKFTAKALETLLDNYPAAGSELLAAYQRQLFESRVKN